MPLPEKAYFALEEVEERWDIQRRDTIYYAENGLLEIAVRVTGVVLETGVIEAEPDGRWFKIPEDRSRFCGLLPLQEHHLSRVFLSGAVHIDSFRADGGRYIDIVEPEGGVEVRLNALVVTRAERDRFERAHGLVKPAGAAVAENRDPPGPWANLRNDGVLAGGLANPPPLADSPVACGEDGGWLRVHGRADVFTGYYQKAIVRRLHGAWLMGVPRLRTQMLLEDIGCRSKQITHVFSGADRRWREIIGYGQGYVWLKRPR